MSVTTSIEILIIDLFFCKDKSPLSAARGIGRFVFAFSLEKVNKSFIIALSFYGMHFFGIRFREKRPHLFYVEFLIVGHNAEKKAVQTRAVDAWGIKNRMIHLRQAAARNETDESGDGGKEDGEFKGDRDKGRPAVKGPASNVETII